MNTSSWVNAGSIAAGDIVAGYDGVGGTGLWTVNNNLNLNFLDFKGPTIGFRGDTTIHAFYFEDIFVKCI